MFAETTPKEVTQDYLEGNNDLYAAKSARWLYLIDNKPLSEGYDKKWSEAFEVYLQRKISSWGDTNRMIDVAVFSIDAWQAQFLENVNNDIIYTVVAGMLVISYSFVVIGGLSPIHFRSAAALVGMTCIFLSITSGYGIALALGWKTTKFHAIIPFMIMGIGVDDMFVIVNTTD
jgi:predicted RND superfamily exporter protein